MQLFFDKVTKASHQTSQILELPEKQPTCLVLEVSIVCSSCLVVMSFCKASKQAFLSFGTSWMMLDWKKTLAILSNASKSSSYQKRTRIGWNNLSLLFFFRTFPNDAVTCRTKCLSGSRPSKQIELLHSDSSTSRPGRHGHKLDSFPSQDLPPSSFKSTQRHSKVYKTSHQNTKSHIHPKTKDAVFLGNLLQISCDKHLLRSTQVPKTP